MGRERPLAVKVTRSGAEPEAGNATSWEGLNDTMRPGAFGWRVAYHSPQVASTAGGFFHASSNASKPKYSILFCRAAVMTLCQYVCWSLTLVIVGHPVSLMTMGMFRG